MVIGFESPERASPATTEVGWRPAEDVAHRQALRLTFSYEKSRVELVLMEAIEMIVPPSFEITKEPPVAEFWYELQGRRRTPLYRRVQRNPRDPRVEIRTGDPEKPLAYRNSGRTKGEFALLLPNLPEARAIALYERSLPRDAVQRDLPPSSTEVARFPLGDAITKEVIARDTIPPRTVSNALAAYDLPAVIQLRASDNTGEVAKTVYVVDDGKEREGLTATVDEPGEHTLRFWSVDRAGNVESENVVRFVVRVPGQQEGE